MSAVIAPPSAGDTPTLYRPELLRSRFRAAGIAGWKRLALLVWTFLTFAFGFWRDERAPEPDRARRHRERAVKLRERFVELGPTFVKIGQVLSTRPDLVPLPYVEEMAQLQDQVPPFDSDVARAIMAEAFGRPPEQVFAVLNPFPIAAASIGQVYKAKLHDGREVVVKVQRPGLIETVSLDLAILRALTAFIDRHPRLSGGMPYTAILDEFGASLYDQADYTQEGRYAERFRAYFKDFPGIRTPVIHWELTRPRVMTMDYVHGMKVTDLVALEAAGVDFSEIVKLGVRATIKQILEDGFFHADMHPGNLFVDYDGELVFIDFGMIGELSTYTQEKIVDVFLHSVHRQYDALVQDFIDLELLSPRVDKAALVPVARRIFEAQYGESGQRLSVKEIFQSVSVVLYEHPFRIPEKIALMLRTLITLEGIIHKLLPDFRFLEVAAPYAAKILLTDAKASIREKLVDELFVAGEFQPGRLAKLFGTATKEPTFRFGEVAPSVLRYLASPDGKRVREALLDMVGHGQVADVPFSWQVYVDKAVADPTWTLDDMLLPVCQFLQTEDGALFLVKVMDRRSLLAGANGAAIASLGVALKERPVSPATLDEALVALTNLLKHHELDLQPVIEKAHAFLASESGAAWFYAMGEYLYARRNEVNGRFLALVTEAAKHPYLDISPLVKGFFDLAMRPEGRPWQELLVHLLNAAGGPGGQGLLQALGPLIADGRLRLHELALPAFGYLFSKDGADLRSELVDTLRQRVSKVDLGGMAQDLWKAAGNALKDWREPPPPVGGA